MQTDDGMLQLDPQSAIGVTRSFGTTPATHIPHACCGLHLLACHRLLRWCCTQVEASVYPYLSAQLCMGDMHCIRYWRYTLKQLDISVGCWRCICWVSRHLSNTYSCSKLWASTVHCCRAASQCMHTAQRCCPVMIQAGIC